MQGISTNTMRRSALLLLLSAPALFAQGAVSGQVTLTERAGETSEDLADVVVWLEPTGSTRVRTTPTSTTIDLKSRQFSPRVRAVTEGSKIEFPNQDSFSHNVFSKAPDGAFDTGVFPRGRTRDQTFKEAGVFPIYCNIHPRMTGYVVVLKSPYFALGGDDGRFAVSGVPAGSYVMHVWHDRAAREATRPITVSAAGLGVGRVELDASGYRYVQHKNKFGQEYTSTSGDRY
jgi:plastocyanin